LIPSKPSVQLFAYLSRLYEIFQVSNVSLYHIPNDYKLGKPSEVITAIPMHVTLAPDITAGLGNKLKHPHTF